MLSNNELDCLSANGMCSSGEIQLKNAVEIADVKVRQGSNAKDMVWKV